MLDTCNHPADRFYSTTMVGIGVLSSAIILAAFYLLTGLLDHYRSEGVNEKLDLVLNDWTNALIASAEDYAFAGSSYDGLLDHQGQLPKPDVMVEPGGNGSFDWIAVLTADGDVIYDLNLPRNWDAASYFSSDAYRPVLDRIAQSQPYEHTSVGGAFERDGVQFLAATTRITPHSLSDAGGAVLPYLIAGRNLNADAMKEIATQIGSDKVFFSSNIAERSVSVEGPLGFVGNLTWDADLPGLQFREIALPWVLMMCAALLVLSSWMAAGFRKMANSLERVHKVATTDHLTGVANRAALSEVLQNTSVQEALRNGCFAAISLDLDDFKQLNDEYGHYAGDTALRIAAERISKSVLKYGTVFRMGGDEFLCLVLDPDPESAASTVVERLKNGFSVPMDLGGESQIVTPSIGVAVARHGENWDALLERSDAAMYRAKRREFALIAFSN